MSEIDYAELDKEVSKAMNITGDAEETAAEAEVETAAEIETARPTARRGRYMDMVHPSSDMRPPVKNTVARGEAVAPKRVEKPATAKKSEMAQATSAEDDLEFGVIEDVGRAMPGRNEEIAEEDFVARPEPFVDTEQDAVPDANNYSLGGRSPFIPDARVEKRPLGNFVPENNANGLRSTRNVYSRRTPAKNMPVETQQVMITQPKKKSGWLWALMTLLVIAAGGGLGVLIYWLYTGQ